MTRATSNHVLYDSSRVSELIGSIYAASTDSRLWADFAEKLGHALELRAVNFMLSSTTPDGEVGFVPVAWGIDDGDLERYASYFSDLDLHLAKSLEIPSGAVYTNAEIVPDEEFLKGEYFNDFYSKIGLRHGFVGMIRNEGETSSLLACHRGLDQQAPSDDDLRLLGVLMEHLQRGRALAVDLGTLKERLRVSNDMIDRLRVGAMILDHQGGVMHANERAQAIFREDDGLSVVDRKLQAARHSDTKALCAVLDTAAAVTEGRALEGPISVRLPRPSGRRPLDISVLPIDRMSEWWAELRASVIVLVNDGEATLEGAAQRLRDLYDLSAVEAELAGAIACGITVHDWADHRGVSVETVRWQLKQVFAKTGTARQPELMRMVLQGPGLLR